MLSRTLNNVVIEIIVGGNSVRKYLRAMIYGGRKTKLFLWVLALSSSVSVGCIIACILGAGMSFAYAGFLGTIFSLAYSQLGDFKDVTRDLSKDDKKNRERKRLDTDDSVDTKSHEKKSKEGEEKEAVENKYKQYTKEKIKQCLVEYKVKQENFRILVDSSEKHKIKCCPAYIWTDKYFFYLLLFEKKPRVISIPRKTLEIMTYEKEHVIRDIDEYSDLRGSVMGSLFQSLMPKYYKTTVNGFTTYMKNLFVLGDDLVITAPSAGNAIKALHCQMVLDQSLLDPSRFNSYFQEVYKVNLLFKEKAISVEEYDIHLKAILSSLVEHRENLEVFKETITQLCQYGMISREYAEYYIEQRYKLKENLT